MFVIVEDTIWASVCRITHLRSRDQQILQARIINLLKTGFEKEKGGIEVKIGEYLHVYSDLVLLYIDLEVSQL